MTDYISRAEAIELMSGSNIEDNLDSEPTSEPRRYARAAQRVIWSIPAADAAPVVRGKWIKVGGLVACSVCKENPPRTYHNFCPNCGAKMDGGTQDETDRCGCADTRSIL